MTSNDNPSLSETFELEASALPALGERFRVIRALGSGAMGEVYLAQDTKLHRRVAIKCIRAEHQASEILLQSIKRECLLHARMGAHAHIVTLYDLIDSAGQLLIVMEYVEGEPLDKRMKRLAEAGLHLEPRECVQIAMECLEALSHTHRHGVIHRDIKPANVILDSQSGDQVCVKLTDFGIARLEEDDPNATTLTQPGTRSPGTPLYMAPEQIDSGTYGPVTSSADIYAVGIMLYHMLAGRPPFTGNMTDIFNGHLNYDPRPIQMQEGGALHPALRAIIEKAMAKRPAERYPTAEAFATALGSLRHLELVIADHEPSRHAVRRRRPTRGGWGMAAAAAGIVLLVGYWFWSGRTLSNEDTVAVSGIGDAPVVDSGVSTAPGSPAGPSTDPGLKRSPAAVTPLPTTEPAPSAVVPEQTPVAVEVTTQEEAANDTAAEVAGTEPDPVVDGLAAGTPATSPPPMESTLPPIIPPAPSDTTIPALEALGADGAATESHSAPHELAMEGELEVVELVEPVDLPSVEVAEAATTEPAVDNGNLAPEAGPRVEIEAPARRTHVVQDGDTIDSVAHNYGVPRDKIIQWNRLHEPYLLESGRVLYLHENSNASAEPEEPAEPGAKESPGQVFKEDLKDVLDKSKQGIRNLGRKVRNIGK